MYPETKITIEHGQFKPHSTKDELDINAGCRLKIFEGMDLQIREMLSEDMLQCS